MARMDLLSTVRDTLDPDALPVLSFPQLIDRLRRSGVALTRSVLERQAAAPDSGLQLIGEATGPLGQLREVVDRARKGPRAEPLAAPLGLGSCLLLRGTVGLSASVCDGLRVVGTHADLRSTLDRARWSRMVAEAGELEAVA